MRKVEGLARIQRRIKLWLLIFIAGLLISGATAIPLQTELRVLADVSGAESRASTSAMHGWILQVRNALMDVNARHPFMAYGTDWLAFAHFVIAVAFLGPWRDPVKNIWVIEFGMIACWLVVPFALIMGGVRGIPLGWRLIDCAFGLLGFLPLWFCWRDIRKLATPG